MERQQAIPASVPQEIHVLLKDARDTHARIQPKIALEKLEVLGEQIAEKLGYAKDTPESREMQRRMLRDPSNEGFVLSMKLITLWRLKQRQ